MRAAQRSGRRRASCSGGPNRLPPSLRPGREQQGNLQERQSGTRGTVQQRQGQRGRARREQAEGAGQPRASACGRCRSPASQSRLVEAVQCCAASRRQALLPRHLLQRLGRLRQVLRSQARIVLGALPQEGGLGRRDKREEGGRRACHSGRAAARQGTGLREACSRQQAQLWLWQQHEQEQQQQPAAAARSGGPRLLRLELAQEDGGGACGE